MEHEKPSGGFPDSQTLSENPEAQPPLPKLLAQYGGDLAEYSLDSSATIKTPATSNVDHGKRTGRPILISKRAVPSLSSTEQNGASDDCELGSRLECLGSNIVGIPLPDVDDPAFDVREWATKVLQRADADKVNFRKASFVFKGLDVSGSATGATVQPTVASMFMAPLALAKRLGGSKPPQKKILNSFDGVVNSGEMLLVLGRPGSGCSTLLRTIAGELGGIKVDTNSTINYNGIPQSEMIKHFAGELVYNADVDKHFPHLTVGETLQFAAAMRARSDRLVGSSRAENIKRLTAVVMAVCGLTHTKNTKVGNDFVRGVSGGERKRVSIAEMMLAWSPIGAWDNSTRGLDSATALAFVNNLKLGADILGTTHIVAIYQASQAIFDVFDKVIVLYEGREIYFGPTNIAHAYFTDMGWLCPARQTTGDFCTSVTNHLERKARPGFEDKVPRTPEEFEAFWHSSQAYRMLHNEIDAYQNDLHNIGYAERFRAVHEASQSSHIRGTSSYRVSFPMQVKICTKRAYQRLWNDKASTMTVVLGQVIMALVVGSVFFGIPSNTNSFFARGSTIFFATLLNALIAVTEINNLYLQRPVVEKHASFAFCHPAAEALAGVISDAPVKMVIALFFNVILYFLAGLSPTASQFFVFFLFTVLVRFTMSAMFRTVAAATKTVSQALAIAGILVLVIVIYTGYTIPKSYMHPWFKWLVWLNPLAYAFEALIVNEFHATDYACTNLVPSYPSLVGKTFVCAVNGAVSGQSTVSGDAYVEASFQYTYSHIWRNLGIVIAFYVFFLAAYLVVSELNSGTSSTAEVLLFRRRSTKAKAKAGGLQLPSQQKAQIKENSEVSAEENGQPKSVFTWRNVTYDIHIKNEPRRLLDNVSGWAKPGTLTALMGVSGAGKTTLLDVLAQRTSVGVVSGDMFVNGKPFDSSFQRKLGYVQQQDLHLETSTVREALRFSAILRQPQSKPLANKYADAEEIIQMLDMEEFAEAIVGVPGEGLNVEQRKLLTIGVELAAKPALLLFLDEPTSGLDSQSSWAIVSFLRKLANSGQAILSTIHQPSSILFQEFDNLLFLAKGGRTVYFGPIGPNSETLLQYFEEHGARPCAEQENPAEYILEAVTLGASGQTGHDWPVTWKSSHEFENMTKKLEQTHHETSLIEMKDDSGDTDEFAMPLFTHIRCCTTRIFQQYWRTPSYIWGKIFLGLASALFIGFSFFHSNNSLQGMQNVVFSLFMLTSILSSMVQQIMPRFVMQRSLYEVRERPSKIYSWIAFMIANIVVELFYQVIVGIFVYLCYYYATFGIQSSERQGLILLFCIEIFIFASTFAQMVIVAIPDAQTAGALATLLFSLTMIFNGVFQPPQALPGFWIFMYRLSPLTYLIGGLSATGLSGRRVICSTTELNIFQPPNGQSCGDYMSAYLKAAPGQLINPSALSNCSYCPLTIADQFLSASGIAWDDRWRNFGIIWAYIFFNITAAMTLYYVFRVSKWRPATLEERKQRWDRFGTWLKWAGIWIQVLIMGIVGMAFSQERKSGNTVSEVNWNDDEIW